MFFLFESQGHTHPSPQKKNKNKTISFINSHDSSHDEFFLSQDIPLPNQKRDSWRFTDLPFKECKILKDTLKNVILLFN
jgi:hypothetical protein